MSAQAVGWALDARLTGPMSAEHRLVLVALADYATPTGHGAWPAVATLAERLGVSTRAVRRSLQALAAGGWITKGDQRQTAHLRGDRRPVVWDLAVKGRQTLLEDTGELGAEPYRGDAAVTPSRTDATVTPQAVDNPARGDAGGIHGVTPASPKPRTEQTPLTHLRTKPDPRRASARGETAAHAAPRPRALGNTSPTCPVCGATVSCSAWCWVRNHTCRASALDPQHRALGLPTAQDLKARATPPPQALALAVELPIEDHAPCTGCGTTSHRRPLIEDTGLCIRCHYAHARDGHTP